MIDVRSSSFHSRMHYYIKLSSTREWRRTYPKGGHWKRNCTKYLADKKDDKVNKSIYDIHVIDVYFTSVHSIPWVFDTSSVAKNSNSKRKLQNEQRLVKGEVTMCVGSGSKIDMIIIAHSPYFRD